jgi:hypothetical protein
MHPQRDRWFSESVDLNARAQFNHLWFVVGGFEKRTERLVVSEERCSHGKKVECALRRRLSAR